MNKKGTKFVILEVMYSLAARAKHAPVPNDDIGPWAGRDYSWTGVRGYQHFVTTKKWPPQVSFKRFRFLSLTRTLYKLPWCAYVQNSLPSWNERLHIFFFSRFSRWRDWQAAATPSFVEGAVCPLAATSCWARAALHTWTVCYWQRGARPFCVTTPSTSSWSPWKAIV